MSSNEAALRGQRFFGLDSVFGRFARLGRLRGHTKILIRRDDRRLDRDRCDLRAADRAVRSARPGLDQRLSASPSLAHPFGTDQFGRDVLSRTIYATRLDLEIAFFATIFCFVLGVLFGVIGGYFGGVVDQASGASSTSSLRFRRSSRSSP